MLTGFVVFLHDIRWGLDEVFQFCTGESRRGQKILMSLCVPPVCSWCDS